MLVKLSFPAFRFIFFFFQRKSSLSQNISFMKLAGFKCLPAESYQATSHLASPITGCFHSPWFGCLSNKKGVFIYLDFCGLVYS